MELRIGTINLITGERDVGKTNLCSLLIREMESIGYSVGGIISPGIYQNNIKMGIASINIKNGDKVKLADYEPGWDTENPLRSWKIRWDAISWGNEVLKKSVPCDVLFIDEIGYLELEKINGWDNSYKILEGNGYKIAFIVVRMDLIKKALSHWGKSQIIKIEREENLDLISKNILHQIEINEVI